MSLAIARGHYKIVKFLCDANNVQLNKRMKSGETPLLLAIRHKQFECIKFLLRANAETYFDNDYRDESPIFTVVRENNLKLISILIDFKADFTKKTSLGLNAIHLAEQLGHHECLSLLWIKCEPIRNSED